MSRYNSNRDHFFGMVQIFFVKFVTTCKTHFPEFCSVVETNAPLVMYECTKYYTIIEKSCKKYGVLDLFVPEKSPTRIRLYCKGKSVTDDATCDLIIFDKIEEDKYQSIRCDTMTEALELKNNDPQCRRMIRANNVSMLGLQCHIKDTGKKFDLVMKENVLYNDNLILITPMFDNY